MLGKYTLISAIAQIFNRFEADFHKNYVFVAKRNTIFALEKTNQTKLDSDVMETMTCKDFSTYAVNIPSMDLVFFRSMARRMGWEAKKINNSRVTDDYEPSDATMRAVRDAREGKVFRASSIEDLFAQLDS